MFRYLFHFHDSGGGMMPADAKEFTNDLDALDHARALANALPVEIWQGARRVARVRPGDAAPSVTDEAGAI